MPLVTDSASVVGQLGWELEKTVTGFEEANHVDRPAYSYALNTTTYNQVFAAQYTIAASGTQAVDFYSFTNPVGEAVTATKLTAVWVKATATTTGGILKIEPHTTNGLTWPFAGTTPSLSLTVGTDGAGLTLKAGTVVTLNSTVRQWLLTNSGNQSITVSVAAFVGTA